MYVISRCKVKLNATSRATQVQLNRIRKIAVESSNVVAILGDCNRVFAEIGVQAPCGVCYCYHAINVVPERTIKILCKVAETGKITQLQCLQGLQSIGNPPLTKEHNNAMAMWCTLHMPLIVQ